MGAEQPQPEYSQKIGLIDMGSGTIRLVVYGISLDGSLTSLFTKKADCSLGQSVAETAKLDEDAMLCALNSLAAFKKAAAEQGVKNENLHTFATAAVRKASNRKAFLHAVDTITGVHVDVISGRDEAKFQVIGATHGLEIKGKHISADLGRGSLDNAAIGRDRKVSHAQSFLLGSAEVLAKGSDADPYIDDEFSKLYKTIPKGMPLHLVGGTWRALAKSYMRAQGIERPKDFIHGYEAPEEDFLKFVREVIETEESEIAGKYGIDAKRLEHLRPAVSVLEQLAQRLETRQFVFSKFGVREGYLLSKILKIENNTNPKETDAPLLEAPTAKAA